MKTLPLEFTESGWHHKQLVRNEVAAIYERRKETSPAPHYEVVLIRLTRGACIKGYTIEAGESYPPASQWGVLAWTFPTEEQARIKYRELSTPKGPKKLKKPQPKEPWTIL